jgi:chromosome segregation ATPase
MKTRISALLAAAFFAPVAGAAYKCVDEKGITHIGDTPPPGCANVVMYEVKTNGAVIRKIDPTPTPEQLKAREAEYEKVKASLKIDAEKKRADTALLSTYSSDKEFDMTRDRNIEPIRGRINAAQERIKQVDKRTQEIEEEMEFYKAGKSKGGKEKSTPERLTAELQRSKTERATLVASIASYEKEIESTRAKYDADKQRWIDLKKASAPAPKAAETASAAPAAPKKN